MTLFNNSHNVVVEQMVTCIHNVSLVIRETKLTVYDINDGRISTCAQQRLLSVSASTQLGNSLCCLRCLHKEQIGHSLSVESKVKTLVRLKICSN